MADDMVNVIFQPSGRRGEAFQHETSGSGGRKSDRDKTFVKLLLAKGFGNKGTCSPFSMLPIVYRIFQRLSRIFCAQGQAAITVVP